MKIIQALKQIKELQRKADDYKAMVRDNCAISSLETPKYENQRAKVDEWLQGHADLLKEILRLRVAIQRTNLETSAVMELGGKTVTKTVAEWIHRRRDLAKNDVTIWQMLTDRNVQEGPVRAPGSAPNTTDRLIEVKVVRFYSPEERDKKIMQYSEEPAVIDYTLEVVNATTDLIE